MRALTSSALALGLALLGVALPPGALAQTADPAATAATTAASAATSESDAEEITCEHEAVTGSRVKKRTVCMTERQRQAEREQTSQALGSLRSNQTSGGN